jgi:tripartite-type tricarboxylate transporter receptor subunit TctC
MQRRCLIGGLAASALLPWSVARAQAGFPSRPVRMVMPFAAGGAPDVLARTLAVQLGKQLGQSVFVENKLGANGIVASQEVVRAAPDGHTLLIVTGSHTTNPSIRRRLPYDTLKDFAPVTQITTTAGLALVVNPQLPFRTPQAFIEAAKGGSVAFGSPGVGNSLHLPGELMNVMAGTRLLHVPYKGAALAVNAVIGGEIQAAFLTPSAAAPLIRSGQLRAIAVTSAQRLALFPDVPTLAESAMPGFVYSGAWMGLVAPGGTPSAITQRLAAEIRQVLQSPDLHTRLTAEGSEIVASTPEEFARFLVQDMARFAEIVRQAGIQPIE